ncbi:hypothetical protein Tco_0619873 [Tanacetum coccineum]
MHGASINLMPLSIWKKLSLPELTPTRMILNLQTDDTEYAQEVLGFSDSSTSGNPTPSLDRILSTSFPSITPFEGGDFILEEIEACLTNDSIPPGIDDAEFDPEETSSNLKKLLTMIHHLLTLPKDFILKEIKTLNLLFDDPPELELMIYHLHLEYTFLKKVIKLLDADLIHPISDSPWVSPVHCVPKKGGMTVVENKDNELIPTRLVTGWHVCIDYRKLNDATRKDHFPFPFMDQMLERTFQRCMMAIFHDMIEETMKVFMDDFSIIRDSFLSCLSYLDKMLKQCKDTNLVLNWEKCHFMVKEGIVLGHKISKSGIEVDRAKVDAIAKLPHPTSIKGV